MSETLFTLTFSVFAGLVVFCAVLVVMLRNILHAAVALFFCLSGIAVLYVLLGADFLGVSQLLVYAGGILVLIIFGVLLTARIYEVQYDFSGPRMSWLTGLGLGISVFGVTTWVLLEAHWPLSEGTYEPTTKTLGELLLTKYLLPFEVVSILLLFALVGGATLVRKEIEKP